MYLYHYGFRKLPFSLTPDTELFCALPSHKSALNTLKFALSTGEAFCKITGEVGSGKTMLCRLLINKIGEQRQVAYIPNPVLTPRELKLSLAHELNMRLGKSVGEEQLVPKIQRKLIDINKKRGPVILIIDEAQSMPDETLEALRLFTNLETESNKLMQIVLFAQPELDSKLSQPHLRQLRQRIVFSHKLFPLTYSQTKAYLNHRIAKVSVERNITLSNTAQWLLHKASRGIPRLINILTHKSLMLAYGANKRSIGLSQVWHAVLDTDDTRIYATRLKAALAVIGLSVFSSSALALWIMP
ncbi:ExeA family protein [Pleionea mediterranea]|uniref:MSHA biogenesis protein MshM n=1 Tax=Pleionea mediterranea TaxID=523701 RepID=A0A316FZ16_9GAMM|nr:AAA family ATPase [Pleionea mediterranea]PWK52936.1 MSHA biogenesis protein MshM [Pleionea mediterranea]